MGGGRAGMSWGNRIKIALAGQPNCGKSTIFNLLTGAKQHIANYPGVTVEKKTGSYRYEGESVEVVDLPGTYSLTSYSMEERVSRDFLFHEKPGLIVNVVDASSLKKHLYLTFQLLEMEVPVLLDLNMIDVAKRRAYDIDVKMLSQELGIGVVETVGSQGHGKEKLRKAISRSFGGHDSSISFRINYWELEPYLEKLTEKLSEIPQIAELPSRWMAVKLMEGDAKARNVLKKNAKDDFDAVAELVENLQKDFRDKCREEPEHFISSQRHRTAEEIADKCTGTEASFKKTFSDRVDQLVCGRFLGPVVMLGVIYLLYELSIVQGYKVTDYTWPLLAGLRNMVDALLPEAQFIDVPYVRSLVLWLVDSINALLNYIPVFFILFALIAILEDVGYMPRMAFILDRIFRRYGLHGQSTLPMILGGVYVGGCAVPGVMATKGIADERARMATILIVPLMNCLAKIPFYMLLINIYFTESKALVMFFISTITIVLALFVAKVLSLTLLKNRETAPFVMEMPPYHLPTVRGVLGRAVERVWLYLKKVVTVVAAVAVVIFVLIQFPGVSQESKARYHAEADKATMAFHQKVQTSRYAEHVQGEKAYVLINYYNAYKKARSGANKEKALLVDTKFEAKNPYFFKFIKPKKDKDAKVINQAMRKLDKVRKRLLRQMKDERIDKSFLGQMGRSLEPITQYAGFNWRINVGLLSALAAKESTVATLGALYEQPDMEDAALEERMSKSEGGLTPLHALAMLIFMALYPPCIPALMMVKLQAGSYKWMLFSLIYPTILGLLIASALFTIGSIFGVSGLNTMLIFYGIAMTTTVLIGFLKDRNINTI
jgi:ferrous iron transport protein B